MNFLTFYHNLDMPTCPYPGLCPALLPLVEISSVNGIRTPGWQCCSRVRIQEVVIAMAAMEYSQYENDPCSYRFGHYSCGFSWHGMMSGRRGWP